MFVLPYFFVFALGFVVGRLFPTAQVIEHPKSTKEKRYDIGFNTEEDAKNVYRAVKYIISTYGFATLIDVHDLCELPSQCKYELVGWKSMDGIKIVKPNRMKGERDYILSFPWPNDIWENKKCKDTSSKVDILDL